MSFRCLSTSCASAEIPERLASGQQPPRSLLLHVGLTDHLADIYKNQVRANETDPGCCHAIESRKLTFPDYWRATLRLQQEWGRDDPELLKFSPNIDTYALINLVQKGLQYVALEEELKVRAAI